MCIYDIEEKGIMASSLWYLLNEKSKEELPLITLTYHYKELVCVASKKHKEHYRIKKEN